MCHGLVLKANVEAVPVALFLGVAVLLFFDVPAEKKNRIKNTADEQTVIVACCKSNDGTTKARRYRFMKGSEKETYLLPGTKGKPIVQVDKGRNYYPTSFNILSLVLLSKHHEKVLPGTSLNFLPRSLRGTSQIK